MDYIKIYTDMLDDHFDELTDAEVGEIVRCALRYVRNGEDPEFERRSVLGLTWKRFKAHIDQSAAKAETLRANGSKGKQTEASESKPKQTEAKGSKRKQSKATESKPEQTEASESKTPHNHNHNHNQEHNQNHEQEQEQKEDETRTGDAREWKPRDGGKIIGIDGSDLSEAIRANDAADGMIARFNLPRDIPTREKLLEDIAANGETVMREVLEEACASNTRERVTARYWRAILQNRGKPKPSRASPEASGYMTGTAHRDDDFWKSLEVDLDADLDAETS